MCSEIQADSEHKRRRDARRLLSGSVDARLCECLWSVTLRVQIWYVRHDFEAQTPMCRVECVAGDVQIHESRFASESKICQANGPGRVRCRTMCFSILMSTLFCVVMFLLCSVLRCRSALFLCHGIIEYRCYTIKESKNFCVIEVWNQRISML